MKNKKLYTLALLILFLGTLGCNLPSSQVTPSFDTEITASAKTTDTKTPAATFTFTPSPTVTFTPMLIQQLATNKQIDFNQPFPLSLSPPQLLILTLSAVWYTMGMVI